jgi:hypothetical protein
MAILIYKSQCRAAASVANVAYILREDACQIWSSQHIEVQSKSEALSYAEARQWEEDLRPLRAGTERRNHTRLELSFASESNPERALEVARTFVKKNFAEARAILAVHTNTANIHVHVWLDNRDINNKRLHLSNGQYKNLRNNWTKFTDRIYNETYSEQFSQVRTRPTRHEQLMARRQGEQEYEQRRINRGEYITAAAGRTINESARRIDEASINRQLELETFTRQSLERSSRSVVEGNNRRSQTAELHQIPTTPSRSGERESRSR